VIFTFALRSVMLGFDGVHKSIPRLFKEILMPTFVAVTISLIKCEGSSFSLQGESFIVFCNIKYLFLFTCGFFVTVFENFLFFTDLFFFSLFFIFNFKKFLRQDLIFITNILSLKFFDLFSNDFCVFLQAYEFQHFCEIRRENIFQYTQWRDDAFNWCRENHQFIVHNFPSLFSIPHSTVIYAPPCSGKTYYQ
jgi:hypothetical protein